MKKLFILSILTFLLVGVVGCTTKITSLDTPTNVKIEEDIITFDSVANAERYRLTITDDEGSLIKRFVTSGEDLNNLNISEGTYMIKVQAINDSLGLESDLSEEVSYKQKDLYAVTAIEGSDLMSGEYVKWMGQNLYDDTTKMNTMYYSASGFEVKVKRTEGAVKVVATLSSTNTASDTKNPYVVLVKDNDLSTATRFALTSENQELNLVGEGGLSIDDDEIHTITFYKSNESIDNHISLKKLSCEGAKFISGVEYKSRKMIVYAASSSTGYGNLGSPTATKTTKNSDAIQAFAFLTAQNLNAEINIVSASGWGIYASRWTSPNTICMRDRYKYVDVYSTVLWDSANYTPDVIVTNFGTNDLSYINVADSEKVKLERIANFETYYVDFLKELHQTYPNAKIIILYGLMVETGIYSYTEEIYNTAKESIPDLEIVKIIGDQKGSNSHPSASCHIEIAEALSTKIKEVMSW